MTISLVKLDDGNIVKDENDRVIIRAQGGRVAIARFPDMNKQTKSYVAKVYADLTGIKDSYDKVMCFLNYETEEEEFCS